MHKPTWIALALLSLSTAAPVHAAEPTASPTRYRPDEYPEPSARGRILIAGASLAVGSYGLAFGTSYLWSDAPTAEDLRIPVAGPALAVVHAGCGDAEVGCGTFTVVLRTIVASLSGIGQIGGLGVLAEGVFLDTGPDEPTTQPPASSAIIVSPMADETALGLSVSGSF